MKITLSFSMLVLLILFGCSKPVEISNAVPGETRLKSARASTPFNQFDDNPGILQTALFLPPTVKSFNYAQFAGYDFKPYLIDGETEYNPANYDLMAHFQYTSPEAVSGAVIEFTFHHIKCFVPHVITNNKKWVYTTDNGTNNDSKTIITCVADLVQGVNSMFCFIMKVDCDKGNSVRDNGKSGYTTFWTDMTVNGISVKGPVQDKVFDCN